MTTLSRNLRALGILSAVLSLPHIAAAGPYFVSVSTGSGVAVPGTPVTLTQTFGHTSGATNIQFEQLLIHNQLNGVGACYLSYDRASNSVVLQYPSSGSGWSTPGSGQTASNAQCTLYASGSFASYNGNSLSVTYRVSFAASFGGNKDLWVLARDYASLCAGWSDVGNYRVDRQPYFSYLSPSSKRSA
jgi:hypothetical protein